jgi:hypothetical protein
VIENVRRASASAVKGDQDMPRLKSRQKAIPTDERTVSNVIWRLAHEAFHLREDFAALKVVAPLRAKGAFFIVTFSALQADILVRLMRVLEWEERVGSFWLLYDLELAKADSARINRLKSLAKRLLKIRNRVFVHIDARELFDPERVYRNAQIKWRTDIESAIDLISNVIDKLFLEKFGHGVSNVPMNFADFEEIFTRNVAPLLKA